MQLQVHLLLRILQESLRYQHLPFNFNIAFLADITALRKK